MACSLSIAPTTAASSNRTHPSVSPILKSMNLMVPKFCNFSETSSRRTPSLTPAPRVNFKSKPGVNSTGAPGVSFSLCFSSSSAVFSVSSVSASSSPPAGSAAFAAAFVTAAAAAATAFASAFSTRSAFFCVRYAFFIITAMVTPSYTRGGPSISAWHAPAFSSSTNTLPLKSLLVMCRLRRTLLTAACFPKNKVRSSIVAVMANGEAYTDRRSTSTSTSSRERTAAVRLTRFPSSLTVSWSEVFRSSTTQAMVSSLCDPPNGANSARILENVTSSPISTNPSGSASTVSRRNLSRGRLESEK